VGQKNENLKKCLPLLQNRVIHIDFGQVQEQKNGNDGWKGSHGKVSWWASLFTVIMENIRRTFENAKKSVLARGY
jgi:hypothetical protein